MPAKIDESELEFQSRLELSVLESFTRLSVEDLGHWNLRSYVFKNIDAHIGRATSDEKPHLERLFLLLLIFKCLNRLLEPPKPKQPRVLSAVEQLYREQQRKPVKRKRQYAGEYARRLAKMTPEQLREFRAREAKRIREMRASSALKE